MKYSCLILDHDDTAVDSTAKIHYPAHVEIMKQLRPELEPVKLEGWFRKNFHPGIMDFLKGELAFNEEELQEELKIWRDFTARKTPHFYPGFLEIIQAFRRSGGIVAVVSHSEKDIIEKHYESAFNGKHFLPDIIYGWSNNAEERKPSPFPVQQILEKYKLSVEEVLVVDDLKPGVDMARASGVPIAAAGWAHQIPEIKDFMQKNCDIYLSTVEEFGDYVLN